MLTPTPKVFPAQRKAKVVDGLTQIVCDPGRVALRAVLEQDAELVPTESSERIALTDPTLKNASKLAKHLVPGDMPASVVDNLELV